MKLFSIKALISGAIAVIKRFPLEVLFALAGTIAATANIEISNINYNGQSWCWRIMAGANLGLLLSLAATLYSESRKLNLRQKATLRLVAAFLAVLLIAFINPFERRMDAIRFFLLSLAFHLLVAFAAFVSANSIQGFWQFNKALLLRFLSSVLYSVVLFAGLATAIGAVNILFNVKFEWDTFAILWVWIVGIFNTLFFLAGIPDNYEQLNNNNSYPKALKVFTQFVLIPLATVYLLILLAYEFKLLITWHLPKGMVSNLILGYAVFGILSLLLIYPIRNLDENKWIRSYSRNFYLLLLPLLVLLFVAVGVRISKYGITEYRYFLIVLALWLLFISVNFLLSKKQNIKLIPVSLCIITLLAVYGPQSAFSVSLASQRNILKNLFKRNEAYSNGLLMPLDSSKVQPASGKRAVAVIEYLVEHGDLAALQPFFKRDLSKVSDSIARAKGSESLLASRYLIRYEKTNWVQKQLNLTRFSGYTIDTIATSSTKFIAIESEDKKAINVKGYQYVIDCKNTSADTTVSDTLLLHDKAKTPLVQFNYSYSLYRLKINNTVAVFNLQKRIDRLVKYDIKKLKKDGKKDQVYQLPQNLLTLQQKVGGYTVSLIVKQVSVNLDKQPARNHITYADAVYLIK